jgi:carbonic anhydrase
MPDLPRLLEGNRRFANRFTDGGLHIRPRLSTIVLTCLDSRVDPAHLFDLQLGDALVIRTAGGRINPGC